MRKHSLLKIRSLKRDRKNGYTISQLMSKYSLPKTTVWSYIHGVQPTAKGVQIIRLSRGGNTARREIRWTNAQMKANALIEHVDEKQVWPILLATLYWAEGTKKEFVFTNTDRSMIKIFLKVLRTYLDVTDSDIKVLARICSPMKPDTCRRYWSDVTGIPLRSVGVNFHSSYKKSTTTYGMCRISVRKGGNHLKLTHCLIKGLTDKILS